MSALLRLRATFAILAALAMACARDTPTAPVAAGDRSAPGGAALAGAPVELTLHHSPLQGDSVVAIALRATAASPVAGLQADLAFDPRQLRFQGLQLAKASSALVAAHLVAPGRLRLVAAAAEPVRGLTADAVVLRFALTSAQAISTLHLEAATARAVIGLADERRVRTRGPVPTLDAALTVGAVASPDTAAWTTRLHGGPDVAFNFAPSGRIYGDLNRSGTVSVSDAVLIANFVVGNIIPDALQFEAANVAPANTADGVDVGLPDACRPGRTCTSVAPFSESGPGTITVSDLVLVLNATVGNPVPVVGRSIPLPEVQLTGVVTSAERGALGGVSVTVTLASISTPGGSTVTTDANGIFIADVFAGSATLTLASLPNGCINPGPQAVTVAADASAPVTVAVTCFPPLPAPALPRIAAGGDHSCALNPLGEVSCFGHNANGQLGDGTTLQRSTAVRVAAPAGVTFAQVAAGGSHSCAVTSGGEAYCWGGNTAGQLGDGTTTQRQSPVRVITPAGVTFAQLAAATVQTCGVTTAGAVYCWGLNRLTPILVPAPVGVIFTQVATYGEHACGVSTAGSAYCWGDNSQGQLGDGTSSERVAPVLVTAPTGVTFTQVATGAVHSCGLTTAGAVYCWGNNQAGQLGADLFVRSFTPVLVNAPAGVTFTQLSAGGGHSCAVTAAWEAYCWGGNPSGQLGDGTTTTRFAPFRVTPVTGATFTQLDAGRGHTCAATIAETVFCWGFNRSGQLGDGTTTDRWTPTPVIGP